MKVSLDLHGILHGSVFVPDIAHSYAILFHGFLRLLGRLRKSSHTGFKTVSCYISFDTGISHNAQVKSCIFYVFSCSLEDRSCYGHTFGQSVNIKRGIIAGCSEYISIVFSLFESIAESVDSSYKSGRYYVQISGFSGCKVHSRGHSCSCLFSIKSGSCKVQGSLGCIVHSESRI